MKVCLSARMARTTVTVTGTVRLVLGRISCAHLYDGRHWQLHPPPRCCQACKGVEMYVESIVNGEDSLCVHGAAGSRHCRAGCDVNQL
jgi:hypothetical protein